MYGGGLKPSDPRRFLIEAMVGGMQADGHIEKSELEIFERNLQDHELFAGLNRKVTAELVEMANESIKFAGGAMQRVETIARGLPSRTHRMAAYAVAAEICFADGETSEERLYLEALKLALGLDDEEAAALKEAARRDKGMAEVEDRTRSMRQLMTKFIDCMAIMAVYDGVVTDKERAAVIGCVKTIADMAVLSDDEIAMTVDDALRKINEKDIENELFNMADNIPTRTDRYWAAVYMMVVALADNYTNWRHLSIFTDIKEIFALSEATMDKAMETAKQTPIGKRIMFQQTAEKNADFDRKQAELAKTHAR
jgi:uncharacterized membrane protein YebE (DUF533 family)